MIILVLGAAGMLGHVLTRVLAAEPAWSVHAAVRTPPPAAFAAAKARYHAGVELGGGSGPLAALLAAVAPDVVVNAAGAVRQKDLAAAVDETFRLNGVVPHLAGLLNPNPRGRVIHVSTDCVFRGDRGAYREDHRPDAEDLYGRSKACGELEYGPHLTLRTSLVGWEYRGFHGLLSWLVRQRPQTAVRGWSEAVFSGLPTVTLARTVRDLLAAGDLPSGIFHVASEPIRKLDLIRRVDAALGLGLTIVPDASVQVDRSLDDAAFRARTGTRTPCWDTLVEVLAADFRSLPYAQGYAHFHEAADR